jgi:[protein-PII] uridylyltransferase
VNIITAKITTLGERAEDVFLVHGGDLGSNKTILAIEQDLVETLRR